IKYIILIAVFAVTMPFWLPTSLGGDTSYHFVLTDSMKGTYDPGSFLILRRSDSYQIGDAVGYYFETGNGERVTILHRIIDRNPDGKFILKGDAVNSTEVVDPSAVRGKTVFALPALGFLPGAFRQMPVLLGGMLLAIFFMAGGIKQSQSKKQKAELAAAPKDSWSKNQKKVENLAKKDHKKENMFLPATLVILATIPFASLALGDMVPMAEGTLMGNLLSKVPLVAFLLAVVAVTRLGEVVWVAKPGEKGATTIVEANYVVVMAMAVTVVPFPIILESLRSVITL
ncbi:MAG: hypothetical protein IID34_09740, partial [Planctomycetes bacterium]|nr:hypothetical protein [Planctomycetota bacterium]